MQFAKTLLLLSTLLTFSSAQTITIVGDEWCTYNCKATDTKQGYLVDIARFVYLRK
ncbi:MAG: hypothetical protein SPLUMA2_SPLUMAMAG2_00488 [uncultured Sulfurimonas sp.]|nr:MAG: hypothetical protein SPLUMA2_SPLUMAMAG2_00488 [uncultured Sulfurimonas sp.]